MPLPESSVPRTRLHQRRISYEGWQRDDGLVDIDAHLVDTKDQDYVLLSGLRPAGEPIHDMRVRVTVSRDYVIRAIEAVSERVPYPGGCELIGPEYRRLVGANLMQGFRKRLHDLMGGTLGCTHITELIAFLPTATLQTFAGLRREIEPDEGQPFQMDRCHALLHSSETVRRFYPKWYRSDGPIRPRTPTTQEPL
jgi:Protein of unknown function (DUF2889)